ncbi:MAG: tetratricopeptide repeat protein [Mariniblastus sp.]
MQQLIIPIQKITIFAIAIAIFWIPYPITPSAFSDATFQRVAAQETDAASDRLLKAQKSNELGRVAMSSFREGKYKAAFKNCSELCQLEPNNLNYQMMLGDISFAAGQMDACVAAYDKLIELQPSLEPRLWQRGLALYYAKKFEKGVQQFETHQLVNTQDVENAVWHLLCAAKISNVEAGRKKLIPISEDRRVPMSQIYEMYAGRMTPEQVLTIANQTSPSVELDSEQHRLQRYYAHLYIGLYYEMLENEQASLDSMKKATELNPLGKTNFMGQVARVHLQLRQAAKQ